jgi:VTC domain protein
MAAMHDLPANKWYRTLRRYFPEYVEAPELTREESLAMAA